MRESSRPAPGDLDSSPDELTRLRGEICRAERSIDESYSSTASLRIDAALIDLESLQRDALANGSAPPRSTLDSRCTNVISSDLERRVILVANDGGASDPRVVRRGKREPAWMGKPSTRVFVCPRTGVALMAVGQRARLKAWIVDIFANVDTSPVWAVIVAKVVHHLWPGFRES